MREQVETAGRLPAEDREKQRWMRFGRWKDHLLALFVLLCFGFFINRGIEVKGLYMDDLYLWSCYGEQSFFEYVFPMGSTRFRFLYYLAAWLELALIGSHLEWIVPINILLNVGVAYTLYCMARNISRSTYVGILCGIAFLASRMSYYQIGQLYGLMETMALWMALWILYLLYVCLNEEDDGGQRQFLAASAVYFGICFVHERYMVLLPLFFLVLLMKRMKNKQLWAAPAAAFAVVQAVRYMTIGTVIAAGTGGTEITDTFSVVTAVRYAFSQVAYLFGINAGPDHLNGENFRLAPIWVIVLIAVADLMLIFMLVVSLLQMVKERKTRGKCWQTALLFWGFLVGCIACSSVTIRVEMRWVYVSYAGALLYLSWMYRMLTDGMVEHGRWINAIPYLSVLSLYVILMLPVEMYYRGQYPNLYYAANQARYNSLAEETYGTYGDEIFGKNIYIVGNTYEMSDFTAETFFKTFDPQRTGGGTTVKHIEDVREIGLVTPEMLILQEDPKHNRFVDITDAVRRLKCRSVYGYYEDGWIDERAEIQVMAGASGVITMNFYYPGEVTDDQWMMIYVNGEPHLSLQFESQQAGSAIEVRPYETVTLRFEPNFWCREATEQRGERRMAAVLALTAD